MVGPCRECSSDVLAELKHCAIAELCHSRAPAAELGDSDAAAAGAGQALCASSCASVREAAPVWPRQNNLARRQTSPPSLVTPRRPSARMTQVLVSLNTLGLEMNRQVMTVTIDFISGPLRLSRIMDAKSLQVWILSLRLTFMRAS